MTRSRRVITIMMMVLEMAMTILSQLEKLMTKTLEKNFKEILQFILLKCRFFNLDIDSEIADCK